MTRLALVLLCGLAVTARQAAGSPAVGERRELLPRAARWQFYPSDVVGVQFDSTGRPWFELDGTASIEQIKRQVEQAWALQSPWVRGARILLFDSSGKIWLCPSPDLLLAYDQRSRYWIEHPAVQPDTDHAICGPAIEDNRGRIFIGDRAGCHVFDQGKWGYQPFYELNVRRNLYFGDTRQFYIPMFAQDARGRVYAWSQWGWDGCTGTIGFWLHEQGRWQQMMTGAGPKGGHMSATVPLPGGQVLVCPETGAVSIMRVDMDDPTDAQQVRQDIDLLATDDFRRRRDAERRIIDRGPHVLPRLRDALPSAKSPEQRTRLEQAIAVLERKPTEPQINGFKLSNARYLGRDGRGEVLLWADTVGPDGRAGRTAAWIVTRTGDVSPAPEPVTDWAPQSVFADSKGRLFMTHYKKGLGVLDRGKFAVLTDATDVPLDSILGEDKNGRVYVRNRWQIAALDLDAPDTRRALPVEAFDLAGNRPAAYCDLKGRTVARLFGVGHSVLSACENGRWTELPEPASAQSVTDLFSVQSLREGALVAQEEPGGRAFYFDGSSWATCSSLRELVQNHYKSLAPLIDNQRTGIDNYAKLRVDARGAIWCAEWDRLATFDGVRWRMISADRDKALMPSPIRYCIPCDGGAKMLLSDDSKVALAKNGADGILINLVGDAGQKSQRIGKPSLDARGRVWLAQSLNSAAVLDHGRLEAVPDTGLPRLEDSGGRIWFLNPAARVLVVLGPDGKRAEVFDDAISDQTTIVQDKPNSYWLNTRRGLSHVVADKADPWKLSVEGEPYERSIPKGPCNDLWIDGSGALWFSAPGRLYRITLP